jgi:homopolymeric O-antigen transport system ATP-binding protein
MLPAIEARHIAKMYKVYASPAARLRELVSLGRRSFHQEFWALDDISFAVPRGGSLGIIGLNGSGKSTLLEIVAGTLDPTRGQVITRGRVAALLALGAGFNPEFTGRENIRLNGEILGLSRGAIERQLPAIERFAEIGEFIDRLVKTYSTGMVLRLAFAVAIHVDPEVLVVDEVLAVGDAIFVNRCVQKFGQMRKRGVTVLLVSHDLGLVKLLCDRAMLLSHGRVVAEGEPGEVVNRYNGMVLKGQQAFAAARLPGEASPRETVPGETTPALSAEDSPLEFSFRHGDQQAVVAAVDLFGEEGKPARALRSGEPARVRIVVEFREPHPRPVVGIMIRTRIGMEVFGTNTELEDAAMTAAAKGEAYEVNFEFGCWLAPQEYTLTVATQSPDGSSHDWLDDVLSFQVIDAHRIAGVANLRASVSSRKLSARSPIQV